MNPPETPTLRTRSLQQALASIGAVGLTAAFFLLLPLIQTIHNPHNSDVMLQEITTASIPPPPPPPEEQPEDEQEPEPEETPPELTEEAPPLDLAQLELALNPSFGAGLGGDFGLKLQPLISSSTEADALFSLADLDQKPRVIFQPGPVMTADARRQAPGTVYILFQVDEQGNVMNPMVQKSTNPVFDQPALDALKKWRFEPGMRKGKAVTFKMRIPITFPKR